MSTIKQALFALAAAAAVVYAIQHSAYQAGWSARDVSAKQALAAQQARIEKLVQSNQSKAQQEDQKFKEQLASAQSTADAFKKQLQGQIEKSKREGGNVTVISKQATDKPVDFFSAVVPDVTVSVLNQARASASGCGEDCGAATGADEKGSSAAAGASVTGADIALNDLEVVALYGQLARRHDGLVDWVAKECAAPWRPP